ncbi:sulfite exporter TauE/SafE family protein [Ideonella sp. A 288]|uniref:sulfite exporter TauE/SafE family protein n=1 Tax=Ideonella sp. A 288 TaxID=1962181 RepID=UPI001F4498C4|nr:sulfite exporter TauE/SafE family protein [Ideonella sp. A 288]
MTELSWPDLAAAAATITLAYTVFGFGGFGANLVALPLLAHVMTLRFAVPMLLVLDLFSAGLMGLKNRPLIERAELLRLVPWLLVGMGLGVVLLQHAQERWLLAVLGASVLAYALWSLFGHADPAPLSTRWAVPAGLVGGVYSSMFGTGGPVYTLYFARRIHDTARLRATIGALILGSAVVRLVLFTGSGFYAQPGLVKLALVLVPCAVLGYLIGSRLHARVPQAQVRRVIWALLAFSGASLLWRGWQAG